MIICSWSNLYLFAAVIVCSIVFKRLFVCLFVCLFACLFVTFIKGYLSTPKRFLND